MADGILQQDQTRELWALFLNRRWKNKAPRTYLSIFRTFTRTRNPSLWLLFLKWKCRNCFYSERNAKQQTIKQHTGDDIGRQARKTHTVGLAHTHRIFTCTRKSQHTILLLQWKPWKRLFIYLWSSILISWNGVCGSFRVIIVLRVI